MLQLSRHDERSWASIWSSTRQLMEARLNRALTQLNKAFKADQV